MREWVDVSAAGKQPMNSGSGGSIHIAIAIAARHDRTASRGGGVAHGVRDAAQRSAARLSSACSTPSSACSGAGAGAEKRRSSDVQRI